MVTSAPPLSPPSGWYPDPHDARLWRWWSGVGWTEYTYPVAPARPPRPAKPPRKWIGRFGGWIIAAGAAGIWLWIFGFSLLFAAIAPHAHDDVPAVVSPFLLLTGSATVALAVLYTMAYKLEPEDRLSAPRLVLIAALGGLAATLVAAPANTLIDLLSGGTASHPSGLALLLVGVVEETVKLAAVILLAFRLPVKNARIGLFVGGAVGLGFSVIENVGYLLQAFATGQETGNGIAFFIGTTIGRQLTGPFLHPVFSALLAAAVFGAVRDGRFRITLLVVLAYLGVVVAHSGFDSTIGLAQTLPINPAARGGLLLLFYLIFALGSGFVWLAIVRRIRRARARVGEGAAVS